MVSKSNWRTLRNLNNIWQDSTGSIDVNLNLTRWLVASLQSYIIG